MDSNPVAKGLAEVTKKWTAQRKAEEKRPSTLRYRETMWRSEARTSLKDICYEVMEEAWNQASDNGRLPTHWRQVFYVARPPVDGHPESDRPLIDTTFKGILESYLEDYGPGWDILRGARGVFKEPHDHDDEHVLALSTMAVRNYLGRQVDTKIQHVGQRFPTSGSANRFGAILICEKEGFDELLKAENIPERYDIALMSTKGISALAARRLVEVLNVPSFLLHDMDKNGFVMAGGFPFATDIGLGMADVEEWNLRPEDQSHRNKRATYANLLKNGATEEEAEFISEGQRVELNMLTGPQFIEFVERKLEEHGVEKVVPDADTLAVAWRRAQLAARINKLIDKLGADSAAVEPPADIEAQLRAKLEEDDSRSWDDALQEIVEDEDPVDDEPPEAAEAAA